MKPSMMLLLVAVVTALSLNAADWPNWRGPDHNGISQESGWMTEWPAAGPKVLWKANVGTGFSSFAVANGQVFTMGNEDNTDTVWCLDAATGAVKWKHSYTCKLDPNLYEGGPNATPTVDGNRVYTLSKEGHVFCLNAGDGSVVWSKHLGNDFGLKKPQWGFSGSALIHGDMVVFNGGEAGIAFNKTSGETAWVSGAGPGAYSTPLAFDSAGTPALAIFSEKDLIAVSAADGKELWRFPWKTSYGVNAADPILTDNRMFISSGYNQGAALLQLNGSVPEVIWQNKNMRSQLSGGVIWQGHAYGVDDNQLRCLDLATGEVKWTERSVGKGSLMLADEYLLVLTEKGEMLVAKASPDAFSPMSKAQVLGGKCWTVPVLANGQVYARNAKGNAVCLDVKAN